MKTTKNKKRMNMGGQVPAASFLEQPTVDPFAASSQPVKNSAEFTARSGGVKKKLFGGTAEMRALKKSQRKERKEARQDRREDRRLTRQTVRSVKSDMRTKRRADDGSGPIVELTRDQKRDDRKATRTAGRLFKKQERTERRQSKKDIRTKQSGEKATQKETDKGNKANAIAKKLSEFNEKKIYKEIDVLEKNNPTGNTNNSNTTTTAEVKPKEVKPAEPPAKKQSFKEAFRENRNAGKKEFEWNGKKYHTRTKSEEDKKNNTSSSSSSSSSSTSRGNVGPTIEAANGKDPKNPLNIKKPEINLNTNPTIKRAGGTKKSKYGR
jgi:hypothetical protein